MSDLLKLLKTPLKFDHLPHLFNQGGKEYMQGYESCRTQCLKKYQATGHLEGISPLTRRPGQNEQTGRDKLFIEGHNALLYEAFELLED